MTSYAYADIYKPATRSKAFIYNLILVLVGSAIIALLSQISVRLPLSPVPITAQTLAVVLIGALLGSKRGSLAVLTYLAQGAAGLPVFAGGLSGIAYMVGPTGGYLFGFVAGAFIAGYLAERGWDRFVVSTAAAMLLGNISIYLFGLSWLALYSGWTNVLNIGFYPFIAGDILKLVIASLALPSGWKLIDRVK